MADWEESWFLQNLFECHMNDFKDIAVVGSGPNGLSAALHLAQNGKKVRIIEAEGEIGGAARSGELTLPGFIHDLGSAVHPLALASPFFKTLPLTKHGLQWINPPLALAHPMDDGTAVMLSLSLDETSDGLGKDASAYRKLFEPFVRGAETLFPDLLGPLRIPKNPVLFSKFGLLALSSARSLAERRFAGKRARALFAGLAAHSFLPLESTASSAIALVLAIAGHAVGWPIPQGGAGAITRSMASYFQELGGTITTRQTVISANDLAGAYGVFFDLNVAQVLKIGAEALPEFYRKSLQRFRPGPGVFKLDWALSSPIPWRAKECFRAGTLHLGGTLDEIAESERCPWKNRVAEKPFVLLSQPTLFDPTRAPEGRHVAWAYCHVPRGSNFDMTERIEAQIERFAPGFKTVILKRTKSFPLDLARQNRNLEGGDISGGAPNLMQLFFRPSLATALRSDPYLIPNDHGRWWICSSSSPPGAGVHGMCGYHAVEAALRSGL
jgi:phytoene dehydrogenase-like protein